MPPDTSWAFPLNEFYANAGRALPRIEVLAGDAVPEPYRALLVHTRDMTPTLEAFHGSSIHIDVLHSGGRGEAYFREVVLRLDDNERPVEFGANKVHLARFTPEARWLILQEKLPLGRILKDHAVPHTSRPVAFFRLQSDDFIARALGLSRPGALYGRRATISDAQQQPLSEVVEVLPPLPGGEKAGT